MSSVEWSSDEFLKDVEDAIGDGLEAAGITLSREVRRLLNLRGSSKSAGGQPSPPGEPPARMTGNLWRSIGKQVELSERAVYVGVESDNPANQYAMIHEFGGPIEGGMMPARPYLRPALANSTENLNRVFQAALVRRLRQKGWIE
jgi:phage gpG-like protein